LVFGSLKNQYDLLLKWISVKVGNSTRGIADYIKDNIEGESGGNWETRVLQVNDTIWSHFKTGGLLQCLTA